MMRPPGIETIVISRPPNGHQNSRASVISIAYAEKREDEPVPMVPVVAEGRREPLRADHYSRARSGPRFDFLFWNLSLRCDLWGKKIHEAPPHCRVRVCW